MLCRTTIKTLRYFHDVKPLTGAKCTNLNISKLKSSRSYRQHCLSSHLRFSYVLHMSSPWFLRKCYE